MSNRRRVVRRYSFAFKQKVISEIETGKLTIYQAKKLYDISGNETIQKWIKSFGKNHLLGKVVYIQMTNELDKIKQLEREKKELESALAQAQLTILRLESTIEAANEHFNEDLKKNFDTKVLPKSSSIKNQP